MIWIVVFAGLLAVSVYAARRLLTGVDSFGPVGRAGVISQGLVYAAAVVVASHATDAAIDVHQVSSGRFELSSADKAEMIVRVISTNAAEIAWQAGLLLAAAALVALATVGWTRRTSDQPCRGSGPSG